MKLNKNTGNWSETTEYPGQKSNKILSFVAGEKAYAGLSYKSFLPGISHRDFYELNLETLEWKQLIGFEHPFDPNSNIASISTLDAAYAVYVEGFSNRTAYVFWEFDSNNIVYK